MSNPANNKTADTGDQESSPADGNWGNCPHGTVADVVRNVRTKRRHQSLLRAATVSGTVAAVLLTAGLVYWATMDSQPRVAPVHPSDLQVQGITCREAIRQLPNYLAGTIDHETELRIDRHMRRCPNCRKHIPSDHPKAHLLAGHGSSKLLPFALLPTSAR